MEELKTTAEGQEPEVKSEEIVAQTSELTDDKEPIKDDISSLSRDELVGYFKRIVDTHPVMNVSRHLQDVYHAFKEKTNALNNAQKEQFIEQGGDPLDFKGVDDYAQTTMTTLYDEFRIKRTKEQEALEKQRQKNLEDKCAIIEEMKTLLAVSDVATVHNQFKALMEKWKEIGLVPSAEVQDLNATYKVHVDSFYNNLRISRELRENGLKHNYEEKIKLCEQAEALCEASSPSNAFYLLQQLHNQWKGIGAVPRAESDAIWERFKAATAKVNDRFHKLVDKNKDREKENYARKLALCEEVAKLSEVEFKSAKECDTIINQVLEIQKTWRTIGFAPKEYNDDVYAEFRRLCDLVFERKRKFYKEYNNLLSENYAKKMELCTKAESLADSTDWKVTSDILIGLQKRWKEIGPVAHKHSDEIWKRFRTACDKFFDNKNKHFSSLDEQYESNYEAKIALIEELKVCKLPDDCDEQFKVLQSFQQRWNEIGFVPMKKKNEINQMFSQLINRHFDKLASDDMQRNMQRFKGRVELMAQDEAGMDKLNHERNKLITKLRQIESDVVTLENNIGFFSKSKQSDRMINEVREKIKVAKQNIDMINEKLDILDSVVKD